MSFNSLNHLCSGSVVYEQLGYKAFGIPGKLAASCSITMQNFGGMTSSVNMQITLSLVLFKALKRFQTLFQSQQWRATSTS